MCPARNRLRTLHPNSIVVKFTAQWWSCETSQRIHGEGMRKSHQLHIIIFFLTPPPAGHNSSGLLRNHSPPGLPARRQTSTLLFHLPTKSKKWLDYVIEVRFIRPYPQYCVIYVKLRAALIVDPLFPPLVSDCKDNVNVDRD